MNHFTRLATLVVALTLTSAATAAATAELTATCPTNIRYDNGQQLRFNDRFYYADGTSINLGNTMFYPNGRTFAHGQNYSYPNGQALMTANATYYPDGTNLAVAGSIFWRDGSNLRWGNNYYYDNGRPARIGYTLYLPNGQMTRFPLRLTEEIGAYGILRANVAETSDTIELVFDRLINEPGINLQLQHASGQPAPTVQVTLDLGRGFESVRLTFQQGYMTRCDLVAGRSDRFTVVHPAANLDVQVRRGYDPREVERALVDALDGLERH